MAWYWPSFCFFGHFHGPRQIFFFLLPTFFILPMAASCLITTHFKISKYIFKINFMYRPLSTMTNRYTLSSLFVVLEGRPVATVQQIIFCHPVINPVSSLSCHASHAVLRDQINLEPLICVWCWWFPGLFVYILNCFIVESGVNSSVVYTILWRGTNLTVKDCTAFHTEGAVTI